MSGKTVQKPSQKTVHGSERVEGFSRLVKSVLYDKELSFSARCIYGVLADRVGDGTTVRIGIRLIARLLGANKSTVVDAIEELVQRRHVIPRRTGKQRTMYHLTSLRFGMKQRALDAGEESTESVISQPRRRLATARPA